MQARMQRTTQVDIRAGRIRVPHESKHLFPEERAYVRVHLRGRSLEPRWDPRLGPDQERSGVLDIGRRVLPDLVEADKVLAITRDPSGRLRLD